MKQLETVYGWGISDSPTIDQWTGGKCRIYSKWYDMIKRVKSERYLEKYPSYEGCSVSDEWKRSSDFKRWMSSQIWEGLELDKDILFPGNKVYSSKTCCFVPKYLNYLFLARDSCRGEYPLGVKQRPLDKRYPHIPRSQFLQATVNNGSGKTLYLGGFLDAKKAHQAWQVAKREVILQTLEKYRSEPFYREDVDKAILRRADRLDEDFRNNTETIKL